MPLTVREGAGTESTLYLAAGHDPNCCVKPLSLFSLPRSGLMNLAVGFNPRIGAIIHHPVASATIEPARRINTHVPLGVINPVLILKRLLVVMFSLALDVTDHFGQNRFPRQVQPSLRDGGNFWPATVG